MSTVEAITAAIAELPPEQVAEVRAWLNERAEAEWDARIEQDERAGRLNALADRSLLNPKSSAANPSSTVSDYGVGGANRVDRLGGVDMTGRSTLREIREALAAAPAVEQGPPSAPAVAEELEALARSLEASRGKPPVPPSSVPTETPAEDAWPTGRDLRRCLLFSARLP